MASRGRGGDMLAVSRKLLAPSLFVVSHESAPMSCAPLIFRGYEPLQFLEPVLDKGDLRRALALCNALWSPNHHEPLAVGHYVVVEGPSNSTTGFPGERSGPAEMAIDIILSPFRSGSF